MSVWYKRLVGSVDEFAIEVNFVDDPHEGRSATPTMAASWGSFRLFVRGREPTSAVGPDGQEAGGMWWYLLPLFEWVIHQWDGLLHDARLPFRTNGPSTASSLARAAMTSIRPGADKEVLLASEYQERHALITARNGGIFPNIVFRRIGDCMEVSWDDANRPGGGPLRFVQPEGYETVDVATFAQVWYDTLTEAIGAISKRIDDPTLRNLKNAIRMHSNPDQKQIRQRAAWLLGLRDSIEDTLKVWEELERKKVPVLMPEAVGLYCRSNLPSVLFASMNPDPSMEDMCQIFSLVENLVPMSPILLSLVRGEPCLKATPYKSGYDLALEIRDALALGNDPISIDEVFQRLNLNIIDVHLNSQNIRGISLVAGDASLIAINSNSSYAKRTWSRAAVLAHELCHVLYDRNSDYKGVRLNAWAVASGPWAPRILEQRANAFAAMFLMPEEGVIDIVSKYNSMTILDRVRAVSMKYGVSYRAAIQHLYSLNIVDVDERDAFLEDLDTIWQLKEDLGDNDNPDDSSLPEKVS